MVTKTRKRQFRTVGPIRWLALCLCCITLCNCSFLFDSSSSKYILYPVKQGDNLYRIGKRFRVTSNELQRVNKIRNPKSLFAGQVIKIPYRGQSLAKTQHDIGIGGGKLSTKRASSSKASYQTVKLSSAQRYVGRLKLPVPRSHARLTSKFGRRWFSFHEGVDFAAASGTSIYAAHGGRIVYSGNGLRGYGNLVILKSEGLLTVYGHNRSNLVRVGQFVKQGQRIALVGSTGKSTGPHLHFETRVKDKSGRYRAVDPLVFFKY